MHMYPNYICKTVQYWNNKYYCDKDNCFYHRDSRGYYGNVYYTNHNNCGTRKIQYIYIMYYQELIALDIINSIAILLLK